MRIAVLTFDGFNELDSFVAASILNRVKLPGWKAEITAPTSSVCSMNGVRVERQQPLPEVLDVLHSPLTLTCTEFDKPPDVTTVTEYVPVSLNTTAH